MACREAIVAGVSARLFRIGFVGETGWEIHFAADYGRHDWQAFLEAGADAGIRPFGVEAQRLLRLEKRHVIIGVDTDALTNPFAAEMSWIAKLEKTDFVGRKSLVRVAEESPRDVLTGFIMREKVVPEDGAPVVLDGKPVGRVTSARFSPIRDAGIGLAWMPSDLAADGATIFIRVLGGLVKADVVHSAAFYDPEGVRLRQ
jgi:sarcosine oxidase subunit alpha